MIKLFPLALGLALAPQPVAAAEYGAKFGGVLAGEVLCSLYRQGVSQEQSAAELRRITFKLLDRDLITSADLPVYEQWIRDSFNDCEFKRTTSN
jgi:hypothetical protein